MHFMHKPIFIPNSPDESNLTELTSFFWRQLQEISAQYNEEDIKKFLSWHTQHELHGKIQDPTRFFRVIRDKNWTIIAYFESKQCSEKDMEEVQVIQWFFVKEEYRRKWALTSIWKQFLRWCKENGYQFIWSYTTLQNEVSKAVHRRLLDTTPSQTRLGNTPVLKYGKFLPLEAKSWK